MARVDGPWTSRAAAALALLTLGLALGACGVSKSGGDESGSKSGGGAGADYARAQIKKFRATPKFELADQEKIDLAQIKGKKIVGIPVSNEIPFAAAIGKSTTALSKELGFSYRDYTNRGSVTEWASGINQAIAQRADLILLYSGLNASQVKPQLQRAKEAGIPVLVAHLYQNGTKPPADVRDLITGTVTAPYNEAARLEADYAIADTGGKANVLMVGSSEVPSSNGMTASVKSELKTRCPDCKLSEIDVPVPDWQTKINPEVQSAINKNPDLNYVIPIYDGMSQGAIAGINAAGKQGKVKVATFNGLPFALANIQKGDVLATDISENINWLTYANLDQAFRILTKKKQIDEKTPLRVVDDQNVDQTGEPPKLGQGLGTDFKPGYEKLWGLK